MGKGPDREVTRSDVLEAMRTRSDPRRPWTASELQDELDRSSGAVYNRLRELETLGRIKTKKAGARARIWWIPQTDTTQPRPDRSQLGGATDRDIVEAMVSSPDAAETWTTSELEEKTGHDKNIIYNHLRDLEEEGIVDSAKVGSRARVWWVAATEMEAV